MSDERLAALERSVQHLVDINGTWPQVVSERVVTCGLGARDGGAVATDIQQLIRAGCDGFGSAVKIETC